MDSKLQASSVDADLKTDIHHSLKRDCCKRKKIRRNEKHICRLCWEKCFRFIHQSGTEYGKVAKHQPVDLDSIRLVLLQYKHPQHVYSVCPDTTKVQCRLFSCTLRCSHSQLSRGEGRVGHQFTSWSQEGHSTVWTWTIHGSQSPKSSTSPSESVLPWIKQLTWPC